MSTADMMPSFTDLTSNRTAVKTNMFITHSAGDEPGNMEDFV